MSKCKGYVDSDKGGGMVQARALENIPSNPMYAERPSAAPLLVSGDFYF